MDSMSDRAKKSRWFCGPHRKIAVRTATIFMKPSARRCLFGAEEAARRASAETVSSWLFDENLFYEEQSYEQEMV